MTESKMLIIVPTRSRPENVAKVVEAWEETGAFDDGAELCFAYDRDDPAFAEYNRELLKHSDPAPHGSKIFFAWLAEWKPMVHKLEKVTAEYAEKYFAIGFAGDDHLPRTRGWAGRYLSALAEMGTGIVSCPDGHRQDHLPTQWAMTADIVRALGRMVPAPVEHLYCDDAIRDLGRAADCYRWLNDVLIEHMHPLWRRGQWDDQYRRVNNEEQYQRDHAAYEGWRLGTKVSTEENPVPWLYSDVDHVQELMAGHRAD